MLVATSSLRGARVEGGGSPGSLAFTGARAGPLASRIPLGRGNDGLQSSEMPIQSGASWFGQGDLAARTRVCPDTGDLHVAGFSER